MLNVIYVSGGGRGRMGLTDHFLDFLNGHNSKFSFVKMTTVFDGLTGPEYGLVRRHSVCCSQ